MTGFFMSFCKPSFWLGIYGSILAKTAGISTGYEIILVSIAILMGIIFVDFIYAFYPVSLENYYLYSF